MATYANLTIPVVKLLEKFIQQFYMAFLKFTLRYYLSKIF